MYYIHFWTNLGQLERVPYPTIEEAVVAAWAFEASERIRITGSSELSYDGAFAGVNREKMITVITDENNEDCETRIDNNNGEFFRLKHFLWGVTHNQYFMNESHWADRFEAASRGLVPGGKYCGPDCFNCKTGLDMFGEKIKNDHPKKASTTLSSRSSNKKTIKGRWGFSGLPTNDDPNADNVMRLSESEAMERNDYICARIAEGDSAEGVAEEVGLSVQRVQEIAKLWKPLQSV